MLTTRMYPDEWSENPEQFFAAQESLKEQDTLKTASEGLFLGLLEFASELVGKGIIATLLQVIEASSTHPIANPSDIFSHTLLSRHILSPYTLITTYPLTIPSQHTFVTALGCGSSIYCYCSTHQHRLQSNICTSGPRARAGVFPTTLPWLG